MIVIVLEKATPSLRGELSRWMLEPKAGVFVGRLSARVRDKLWNKACQKNPEGGCIMLYRTNNEQGFAIKSHGNTNRDIVDLDGVQLIRIP